ncbi:protein of unknown function [Petrocella atlantisensis]|jgi:ParB family chromosome partitioning protein|uniref:Uncharacterized protein n=1 Tax=Petrocella atlantisensis TaxID=2173034 RepID=A0A3P7P185_9FIRM|nr:hypothetical protein [Petrocella atlantisensis]VDN47230.1 protein of unknown function [Petrocella atlantisensis]
MEEKNSMCSNWQGDQGIESDKDNKHEKIAVIPLKDVFHSTHTIRVWIRI